MKTSRRRKTQHEFVPLFLIDKKLAAGKSAICFSTHIARRNRIYFQALLKVIPLTARPVTTHASFALVLRLDIY